MSFISDVKDQLDCEYPSRPVIKIADLVDRPFYIDNISIKYGMVTDFGTTDTAIVDIAIGNTPYVAFFRQTVLFKIMDAMKAAVDDGKYTYGTERFKIVKKQSKDKSRTYYDIVDADE